MLQCVHSDLQTTLYHSYALASYCCVYVARILHENYILAYGTAEMGKNLVMGNSSKKNMILFSEIQCQKRFGSIQFTAAIEL